MSVKRGIGRITLAVLLSFLLPGLGQVYAREPLRGMLIAALTALFLLSDLRACCHEPGPPVDAGYLASAKRLASVTGSAPSRTLTITAILLIFLLEGYPVPDLVSRWTRTYLRAYKIPSASMCPTLCIGDRIIANQIAFARSNPGRGDIIMMKHLSSEALFVKRVIGIEGDVITQADGNVFANGQPLSKPRYEPGCGEQKVPESAGQSPVLFNPTRVPAHSFFVVGDNLTNSYDSRIEGFGFVEADEVRGKPLFIYWSWTRSRIGCALR